MTQQPNLIPAYSFNLAIRYCITTWYYPLQYYYGGDCLPAEVHAWHVPLHPAWMEIATAYCISGRILTVLTYLGFPLQYTQTTIIITLWQFHIKHLLVIATKRTCMPILSKSITTYRKFQDRMNISNMYVNGDRYKQQSQLSAYAYHQGSTIFSVATPHIQTKFLQCTQVSYMNVRELSCLRIVFLLVLSVQ